MGAATKYLKAIFAAIGVGLTSATAAYAPHHHIGWGAGIIIATGVVYTFSTVWGVPNYPNYPPLAPISPATTAEHGGLPE